MTTPPPEPQPLESPGDFGTGLPLFRTWRSVYVAVVVFFALWVAILASLPRVFA